MSDVLFFIAAVIAIAGAIGVIALKNPFYSVLSLVIHLIAVALLFLLLHAEFVAAVQVVVYAGAVMVLYTFVAAYLGDTGETWTSGGRLQRSFAILLAGALVVEILIAVLGAGLHAIGNGFKPTPPGYGTAAAIGQLLLTRYLLAFEASSMLLLFSAVGAVLLARRRPGGVPEAPERRAISVADMLSSSGTGSMTEGMRGTLAARAMEADRLAERVAAERAAEQVRAASVSVAEPGDDDAPAEDES
jgi:NADH-quinone oxidoreductase subunit J